MKNVNVQEWAEKWDFLKSDGHRPICNLPVSFSRNSVPKLLKSNVLLHYCKKTKVDDLGQYIQ